MEDKKYSKYDMNYLGGYETQAQIDMDKKHNKPNTSKMSDADNPNQPPYTPTGQQYYPSGLNSPDDYLLSEHDLKDFKDKQDFLL